MPSTILSALNGRPSPAHLLKTWEETITVKDVSGSVTQTIEAKGTVTVARLDGKGVLSSLTVTKTTLTFQAQRQGNVVSYSLTTEGKTKAGTVNLGSKGWFSSWEQAAQSLLKSGNSRLEMILIPEDDPGMNLSFEMKKVGEVVRKGVKTIVFESSAQGMLGMILPKLKLWITPAGQLVAQETLPKPDTPGPGTGNSPPPVDMKPVLQEFELKS